MNVTLTMPVRNDGLSRTTLGIGAGLATSSVGKIVQALQRVPGVLTVDADATNAQAFVAHDAAVPVAALVAAASRAGAAASVIAATGSAEPRAETGGEPRRMRRHSVLAVVGLAAILAVILIDIALPNDPEKRWVFVVPVVLLWAFILVRASLTRRL